MAHFLPRKAAVKNQALRGFRPGEAGTLGGLRNAIRPAPTILCAPRGFSQNKSVIKVTIFGLPGARRTCVTNTYSNLFFFLQSDRNKNILVNNDVANTIFVIIWEKSYLSCLGNWPS
jgi:hypothetical protein